MWAELRGMRCVLSLCIQRLCDTLRGSDDIGIRRRFSWVNRWTASLAQGCSLSGGRKTRSFPIRAPFDSRGKKDIREYQTEREWGTLLKSCLWSRAMIRRCLVECCHSEKWRGPIRRAVRESLPWDRIPACLLAEDDRLETYPTGQTSLTVRVSGSKRTGTRS